MYLPYETKLLLRQAINAACRLRLERDPLGSPPSCGGCGGDLDSWTAGCRTCTSRHRKRMIDYAEKPDYEGFARISAEKRNTGMALGIRFH